MTPTYRLVVDGREITPAIEGRLIELALTDNRGFEADELNLTLDDSDGSLTIPRRGARVHAWIGWRGQGLDDKGSYIVDEVEHAGAPDRLTVRARSADLRASFSAKREQSWHDTTLGIIGMTIAARSGLAPTIADVVHAIGIPHIDQTDESDANLLTRLAKEHDLIATVKAQRLLLMQAGRAITARGTPLPRVVITRADGDSHRFAVADRAAYTGVRANWHDTRTGKRDEVIVGDNDAPADAGTDPVEPSAGSIKTLRHLYASKATARTAARAEWQRLQRGVATFAITLAHGRADLMPEMPARTLGFKPEIDATDWIITRVAHRLTDSGFRTSLELEVLAKDLAE